MPLAGNNNLDELYYLTRLLEERRGLLEREREALERLGGDEASLHIIDVEIRALSEESTRLGSSISDILERDLQR